MVAVLAADDAARAGTQDEDRATLRATFETRPPRTVEEAVARLGELADHDAQARSDLEFRIAGRFDALLRVHESLSRHLGAAR